MVRWCEAVKGRVQTAVIEWRENGEAIDDYRQAKGVEEEANMAA